MIKETTHAGPETTVGQLVEGLRRAHRNDDALLFPKLVVSGGHNAGFDAICDDLAARIGASRMVVEGAGHEIQFAGRPLNEALLALWRTTTLGAPPS